MAQKDRPDGLDNETLAGIARTSQKIPEKSLDT